MQIYTWIGTDILFCLLLMLCSWLFSTWNPRVVDFHFQCSKRMRKLCYSLFAGWWRVGFQNEQHLVHADKKRSRQCYRSESARQQTRRNAVQQERWESLRGKWRIQRCTQTRLSSEYGVFCQYPKSNKKTGDNIELTKWPQPQLNKRNISHFRDITFLLYVGLLGDVSRKQP